METVIESSDDERKKFLMSQLRDLSASDFASRQLLDRVPWLFSDRSQYIDWKAALAADLDLDPFMLLVVGSAATGISLSPIKGFSAFGAHSDIDIAVVSLRHFDEAWRWLRELGPASLLGKGTFELEMLTWHRRNLVFDGAIATEKLLARLPFGPKWASGLGHAGNREPTVGREIKVRIYRDFESLRQYHVNNISELKLRLSSAISDVPPSKLPLLDDNESTTGEVGSRNESS